MINYELIEKNLIIMDKSTGEVIWQGQPFGCPVEKIMPLLGPQGCIVLLDHYEFSQSEYRHLSNLIFYNPDGKIIWTAQLPQTKDSFVDFDLEDNMLYANSWSGFRVQIDLETGRILNRRFTK
jgi:hypothetical protein